jgi:hypothetical protein
MMMPLKERHTQLFLQQSEPGGHVGLHRVQSAGRFRDAAVPGDSRKEIQIGHVHANQ